MRKIKFKTKDQKLQKQEHYPESSFVDCPVKDEDDEKVDEHPVKGLAIYKRSDLS